MERHSRNWIRGAWRFPVNGGIAVNGNVNFLGSTKLYNSVSVSEVYAESVPTYWCNTFSCQSIIFLKWTLQNLLPRVCILIVIVVTSCHSRQSWNIFIQIFLFSMLSLKAVCFYGTFLLPLKLSARSSYGLTTYKRIILKVTTLQTFRYKSFKGLNS